MGVVSSCCIPRRSCDCGGRRSSGKGSERSHRRNLSATFNLSVIDGDDNGLKSCLVNVNTATEEELMTLHGIDRVTAKKIIEHRNHIGGFRCVEDIALVSGVGAAKYNQIRDDIYLPSVNSSPTDKRSEGDSPERFTAVYSPPVVGVNTANIFSLVRIKGIGLALAKNIVEYRDKHGKFNCLEELKKVKGIGPMLFDSIRQWLIVDDKTESKKTDIVSNGKINCNEGYTAIEKGPNAMSSSSLENLLDILGPLAQIPTRPETKTVALRHNGKRIFRLASWNLQRCSKEKAANPGVKDVVCMTILENSFGIVSVQELGDKEALQEICQELNCPTLPNVKKWKGRRGKWKCVVSNAAGRMFQSMEYHGFLYDESQGINLISSTLLEKSPGTKKPFTRMPYLAVFKVNNAFDCVIVSVHLKATGFEDEDKIRTETETDRLLQVVEAVNNQIEDEEDIIILGDFNLNPDSKAFDDLRGKGYSPCLSSDDFTNISSSNPNGNENYDNIWLSRQTKCLLAGQSGVVRDGLFSPWIPDGWSWGGVVSDHCPVFAQLYSDVDMDRDGGDVTATKDISFVI